MPWIRRLPGFALPAALLALFLCIYSLTVFPGPGGRVNYGDSVWKQTIPIGDCTPHVTGFPQYILLSKLFNQLPAQFPLFGSAAYRITSISVLFGALTVLMLYSVVRQLGLQKLPAALTACIFGASYTFWTQATEAEVYTLNTFLFASVIGLLLGFHRTHKAPFLAAGCLVYALSFGNHVSMILLLPALFFLIWDRDRSVFTNPKWIAWALGCVLLSLLQYVYLHQSFFSQTGFAEFLDFMTGGGWKKEVFQFQPGRLAWEIARLAVLTEQQFTPLGCLVAALGALRLYRDSRKLLAFFLLVYVSYVVFSLGYNIGDIQVYYLPAYWVMAVFVGFGLLWLSDLRRWSVPLVCGIILSWQVTDNLFFRDILVQENTYLANLMELVERTPRGSTLLLTAERNWEARFYYSQLANYMSYSGEFGDVRIVSSSDWPRCRPLPAEPTHRILTDPKELLREKEFYLRRSDRPLVDGHFDVSLYWKAPKPEADILLAQRTD